MKTKLIAIACLLSLSFLQAEEASTAPLEVRERLAATWTNKAKRLDSGKRIIYYQGNLKRDAVSDAVSRVTLTGDILVIEQNNVIAASEVSFIEHANEGISVKGPSKTVMGSGDVFVQKRVKELTAKK